MIDEIAAPDFVDHDFPDANGCESLRARVADLHEEWTVLSVTVERVIVNDNLAVVKVKFEVVKLAIGEYGWWTEFDILRLENGKLVDMWCNFPIELPS